MPRISKAVGTQHRHGAVDPPDDERHDRPVRPADDHEPPLVEDLDADDDLEPAEGVASSPEEADAGGGADDALGVYLRQMGAIPLLTRDQELALARRLETARNRFRRAALSSGVILRRVLEMFERVAAGQITLDPTIDVVTSLNLSRDRIVARLPVNLPTLRRGLKALAKGVPESLRAFW